MKNFAARTLLAPGFLSAVAVGMLPVHLLAARAIFSWEHRILGWGLLIPFLVALHRFTKAGAHSVPIVPLVTLQCYTMYGLAVFTQDHLALLDGLYEPDRGAITAALAIALVGTCLFLEAATMGNSFRRSLRVDYEKVFARPKATWTRLLVTLATVAVLTNLVLQLGGTLVPVEWQNILRMTLNPYLILSLTLLLGIKYRRTSCRWTANVMVAAMVFVGMLSSMLETVIVPLYLGLVASWIWGKKLRIFYAVGVIAIFLILNPIKHQFRLLLETPRPVDSIEAAEERMSLWGEAIARAWADPLGREENLRVATDRTSALLNLAQIVEWVPVVVPYRKGEGFANALFYFVPRVVWQNKPGFSELLNNRWALVFGRATVAGLERSTFAILQPADGYWDFGWVGAIAYLGLYGMLIGILFQPYGKAGDMESVLALAFTGQFFQALINMQQFIAAISSMFIGAWMLVKLVDLLSPVASSGDRKYEGTPAQQEAAGRAGTRRTLVRQD